MNLRGLCVLAAVVLAVLPVQAFYLPGVAPKDYEFSDLVELKVNQMESVKTQLPYDYYSLPFCQPSQDGVQYASENLGEVLSGDLSENSDYKLKMGQVETCKTLCKREYQDRELEEFAEKVRSEYRVNWAVDGLPAATKYYIEEVTDQGQQLVDRYDKGFPLGFVDSAGNAYINNHVRLNLLYHKPDVQDYSESVSAYRVVGFEVEPFSVLHEVTSEDGDQVTYRTCTALSHVTDKMVKQGLEPRRDGRPTRIYWTYDVDWQPSDIKWASRWDLYFKMTDSEIHWFSIVNSIMIVFFLTGMIALILMRTLHKDLVRYNQLEESDELDETGWKLIYKEVFRPPVYPEVLTVLAGTGVQVFAMTLATLVSAVLGFLSPAHRGYLMTTLLLLFVCMGALAGFFSTRLYKLFRLTEWKRNTLLTATFFPGVCFSVFFVLNLFVWGEKSSGAVPFTTLISLLVLWLGISVPLVYAGSFWAFKTPADQMPCAVNPVPRLIPPQAWYLQPHFAVPLGGILPFGAVFIEIFFIMSSVWQHQYYYMFGFLFVVFLILAVTCAEIAIVMCYFQLCGEDYHWWWRSYLTPAFSGVYLFLYSIMYYSTKMEVTKFVSTLLFFGYMFLVSCTFCVLTGTIGFYSTFFFVRKIYASIKVD